jgi:hypothetical protein
MVEPDRDLVLDPVLQFAQARISVQELIAHITSFIVDYNVSAAAATGLDLS